jgi:hypothetical protein
LDQALCHGDLNQNPNVNVLFNYALAQVTNGGQSLAVSLKCSSSSLFEAVADWALRRAKQFRFLLIKLLHLPFYVRD